MTVTTVRGSGTNWSGNVTFSADEVRQPTSVQELCDLVVGAGDRTRDLVVGAGDRTVRAVGSRHSFNTIADSPDVMVSLAGLPATVEVDTDALTATVPAGIRFGELAAHLNGAHLALHNTGSLPHISVVGACATGTHGSGVTNGNLATAVRALTLVTADGQVRTLARDTDGDTFRAAALGLGCLGLVTRVTLDVQPEYRVRQDVYEDLPFDVFAEHAEELFAAGYSVSLFTLWRGSTFHQVYVKQRLEDGSDGSAPADLFGAPAADGQRHPVLGGDPASCTQQGGVPGLWSERLYHFRLDFTPSHGDEIQTEYLIPREHAVAAIRAVETISDSFAPLVLTSEIRTIAADDLLASPAFGQDSVALHFTWRDDTVAVLAACTALEAVLDEFGPRPHWGKAFTTPPARLAELYPGLPAFRAQAEALDPRGVFRNDFLRDTVWAAAR